MFPQRPQQLIVSAFVLLAILFINPGSARVLAGRLCELYASDVKAASPSRPARTRALPGHASRVRSQVQDRLLKAGESVEIELRPGGSERFRLVLTPLDYARLAVNPRNQDLTVKIITPAGKEMSVREVPRDADVSTLSFVAGYLGEFRLVIASREKVEPAEKIEIKFADQRTVTPQDAGRIAAEDAFAEGESYRAREVNEQRRPAIARYEEALDRWRKLGDRDGEGRALHALGRVHNDLNLADRAFESFNQALAIRRETKDRAGEAASLSGVANILNTRGERPKAMELFQQVLQIRRELKDRRGEALTLQNLGIVYRMLNQWENALARQQEALQIRREVKDRRGEATSLSEIGIVSRALGKLDQAHESYQQALPIFQAFGDKRGEANTLNNIGLLFLGQGKPGEALDYFKRVLEIQQALGIPRQEAVTLINIGGVYDHLGEKQNALDYFNRALQIRIKLDDRPGISNALNNIGGIYVDLGENRRALEYLNRARPLMRATGGPTAEAQAIFNIGVVQNEMGDRQAALDHLLLAHSLWREAKFPAGQAATLTNIGKIYFALGERRLALDYLNQALEIRRALRNPVEEAKVLTLIGTVFGGLEERQKAIEHFDQALKLAGGDPAVTADTLNLMALAYNSLEDHQKALDQLNQALPLTRKIGARSLEADTLQNIGWVYLAMKNPASSRDYLSQSLEIYRAISSRSNEAAMLFALAHVENDANDLKAARARIEAAIEIAESLRAGLGSTEMRASYFASVQKYYDLYVEILMKLHDRDQKSEQSGFSAEALQVSERARARSLLDLLNESGADIRQGADPALVERERELQQLINAKASRETQMRLAKASPPLIEVLAAEIKKLTAEYQNLQSRIRSTSPRYAALTQPQPLSVKEIQEQVLDRDTLLLEYALGDQQSYLWAVTPASLRSYKLPKRKTIEDAAREVYELLTERNRAEEGESASRRNRLIAQADTRLNAAMARLSRMLLGPVAAQLGDKRLLVVPQGALQYVPFAALPELGARGRGLGAGRKNPQSPAPNPQPLIANHEIVSLPSVSTIVALRREIAGRKPAEKLLAVFADPVFEKDDERVTKIGVKLEARVETAKAPSTAGTRLLKHASDRFPGRIPRLPYTRREAESILTLVPEAERRSALDFGANRAAISDPDLSRYRYLHFATHGMLDSQNPELSSIVLSLVDEGGKAQDGFLRAMEVYNLNLPAEVVVLSACETGLGKQVKGEGLVGLTRGFMYAGTPRIIVSLWAVNDQATAELMTRLYHKMLKENLRPAAALRAAQIEMLGETQWKSPYFWAAFSAQGEWR